VPLGTKCDAYFSYCVPNGTLLGGKIYFGSADFQLATAERCFYQHFVPNGTVF